LERPADEGGCGWCCTVVVDVIQVIVDVGELEQGEISGWHTINTRWVSFTPSTVKGVEALGDF
jgi:hypothetical protein